MTAATPQDRLAGLRRDCEHLLGLQTADSKLRPAILQIKADLETTRALHSRVAEILEQQLAQIRTLTFPREGYYVRRWGYPTAKIPARHGNQIRPEEIDLIESAARTVGRIAAMNRRNRADLLFRLARLGALPSRYAQRLVRLCVLSLLAAPADTVTVPELPLWALRDLEETPRPEPPLARTPNIQQNAPNT